MSEVKRYRFISSNGCAAIPVVDSVKAERFVEEQEFDRVTAERGALQQRLTAADERADVLEGLLCEVEAACDLAMSAIDHDERGANFVRIIAAIKAKSVPKRSDELVAQHAAIDFFDAALKPAEGGGDAAVTQFQSRDNVAGHLLHAL